MKTVSHRPDGINRFPCVVIDLALHLAQGHLGFGKVSGRRSHERHFVARIIIGTDQRTGRWKHLAVSIGSLSTVIVIHRVQRWISIGNRRVADRRIVISRRPPVAGRHAGNNGETGRGLVGPLELAGAGGIPVIRSDHAAFVPNPRKETD